MGTGFPSMVTLQEKNRLCRASVISEGPIFAFGGINGSVSGQKINYKCEPVIRAFLKSHTEYSKINLVTVLIR